MKFLAVAFALLVPTTAFAGKCDRFADQANTATGEALVRAYASLAACDTAAADDAFPAFMRASGEMDTLVALAHIAIDHQIYTPVWNSLESIRDYGQRSEIARGVGAGCGSHPQVVQFLQGAYYGLRDIQFLQWDDGLVACDDEDLKTWMRTIVAAPPATSYDEKYSAVMDAYVKHMRSDALPVLQRAAIESSTSGGPFNTIIEKMDQAVQPKELGASIPPADRARLEESLVAIANEVGPEQAALVADRLYNAGSEDAAATLLSRVYPERVQENGMLLYGAASVESCDQEAIIHFAKVYEPSKRWSILADIEAPLAAFKPRLRCAAEHPWPIVATAEPVASDDELDDWIARMVASWEERGLEAKSRSEKAITLP
ncbi:MAG: hypothetical protein JRI25_11560 [Deltaproteobacteria bacterium]|nr:hypothetical protein [Deltaproteobacteria bacterium]MBW2255222.1 hypothetical protein [Deltaproteobacteria bacterium]